MQKMFLLPEPDCFIRHKTNSHCIFWLAERLAYLILIGPKRADSKLRLHPAFACVGSDVPDGIGQRPFIDLHQDVECPGAGAVGAVQEIVEVDAVSVVFFHHGQLQARLFSVIVLRGVHHHVGAWRATRTERENTGELGLWALFQTALLSTPYIGSILAKMKPH